MRPEAGPGWVEAEVVEVGRREEPHRRPHVVVLRERGGARRLPVYLGQVEAIALACSLDAGRMPRPRVYQLVADLLVAAGSRLTEVRITRLADGVFYAVAVVWVAGEVTEVDARPSDAVNLAVLTGAPIRVDAAVFGDPVADRQPEWEEYPACLADLAAERRQSRVAS